MTTRNEPWYIHAALYAVILVLVFVLIQVAIVEPKKVIEDEKYYKTESRARMTNLREAEILWEEKFEKYSDNVTELVNFIKTDEEVLKLVEGFDSSRMRSTNPFTMLTSGEFIADSIFTSPKSGRPYIVQVDTSIQIDTVINRRGRVIGVDTVIEIGSKYYIECPDGYGSIGDVNNEALKNTASWE